MRILWLDGGDFGGNFIGQYSFTLNTILLGAALLPAPLQLPLQILYLNRERDL